jgi:predicted enzyme related to lactoylglutathione lyase
MRHGKAITQAATGKRCWRRVAWGAWCLMFGLACATSRVSSLPPVTEKPTQLVLPGKFVWVDLVTDHVADAKSFYGALFDWTFEDHGDDYVTVLQDGVPIACIVSIERPPDRLRHSGWVANLSVADVDRAAALVVEREGGVERGPRDIPERGRLALVSDPDGAVVLLVRASGGDPPDAEPPVGRWLWRELWTHDVESAIGFYSALAGYESQTIDRDGQPYYVLKQGDVPRAGVIEAPQKVHSLWLPYVRVEDAAAAAARAESLGARVVLREANAAILIDPTGAAIGVHAWAGRSGEQAR